MFFKKIITLALMLINFVQTKLASVLRSELTFQFRWRIIILKKQKWFIILRLFFSLMNQSDAPCWTIHLSFMISVCGLIVSILMLLGKSCSGEIVFGHIHKALTLANFNNFFRLDHSRWLVDRFDGLKSHKIDNIVAIFTVFDCEIDGFSQALRI